MLSSAIVHVLDKNKRVRVHALKALKRLIVTNPYAFFFFSLSSRILFTVISLTQDLDPFAARAAFEKLKAEVESTEEGCEQGMPSPFLSAWRVGLLTCVSLQSMT